MRVPPNFKKCLTGGGVLLECTPIASIFLESAMLPRMGISCPSAVPPDCRQTVTRGLWLEWRLQTAGWLTAALMMESALATASGFCRDLLQVSLLYCLASSLVSLFPCQSTPCGTRTRNLQIRGPTPCPLGQGGWMIMSRDVYGVLSHSLLTPGRASPGLVHGARGLQGIAGWMTLR